MEKTAKIYTTYFSKIPRLPKDVKPISISLWPPRGYTGAKMPELAPTRAILQKFKSGGSWSEYVEEYERDVLSRLDPHKIMAKIMSISGGRPAALACFENLAYPGAVCHRTLVAQWLKKAGYDVTEYAG